MATSVQPSIVAAPAAASAYLGRSWVRWFVPSLSDVLLIALVAWMFFSGQGWMRLISDADCAWHIRTGESILDSGVIPRTDPYSFTKHGQTWYAWEWGSDVVLATLYRAMGLKGVVLVAMAVIAGTFSILFRTAVATGANALIAFALCLLAAGSASIHFYARPHIATLFLLAVSMALLAADRLRQTRAVWLLVPLTAVWVNLHGGFAILVGLLGISAMGAAFERSWPSARRYALLAAGCAAASLANPFGWGLHAHILSYMNSPFIKSLVMEFRSPEFRFEETRQFEVLLFLGLFAAARLMTAGRFVEPLWIVAVAHMSLESVRHVVLYGVIAVPVVAQFVSALWERLTSGMRRSSVAGILNSVAADLAPAARRTSVVPVLLLLGLAGSNAEALKWPQDFPDPMFPVGIIQRHAAQLEGARVFATDQWSDYLIYRFYPRQRVFFDGRSDFYGPEIGDMYLAILNARWNCRLLLDEYAIEYVLVPVDAPVSSLLKQAGWRTLDDDGRAILLGRGGASPSPKNPSDGLMQTNTAAESTKRDHVR